MAPLRRAECGKPLFRPLAQGVQRQVHPMDEHHKNASQTRSQSSTRTNRTLAIFHSRAKQTSFTPNSPYKLDLPSDILGPFHTPSISSDSLNHPPNRDYSASSGAFFPHPDPAVFSEVEEKVRSVLQDSLNRFSASTITNVGTARATCGLAGGAVIALAEFLPPSLRTSRFPRSDG
jgi:hypothetical protein